MAGKRRRGSESPEDDSRTTSIRNTRSTKSSSEPFGSAQASNAGDTSSGSEDSEGEVGNSETHATARHATDSHDSSGEDYEDGSEADRLDAHADLELDDDSDDDGAEEILENGGVEMQGEESSEEKLSKHVKQPRLSIPREGKTRLLSGPPSTSYTEKLLTPASEDEDSEDHDDDEIKDNITLNLADDVLDPFPGRPLRPADLIEDPIQLETPNFNTRKKTGDRDAKRTNGAIPVTMGLKLGSGLKLGGGKSTAVKSLNSRSVTPSTKIESLTLKEDPKRTLAAEVVTHTDTIKTRSPSPSNQIKMEDAESHSRPLSDEADSIMVERKADDATAISDDDETYSPADKLQPTNPNEEIILLENDESEEEGEASEPDADDDEEDEDDEDEDNNSDNDSDAESVDSETWARQRKYHTRQTTPVVNEASSEEEKKKLEAVANFKRNICDVCQEGHRTDDCDKLECTHCGSILEHFSYQCPTIMKAGLHREQCRGRCGSRNCISDIPLGFICSKIWRAHPKSEISDHKAPSIPVCCYSCGANDHFGDDCATTGHSKNSSPVDCGSPWNATSASQYTTLPHENNIFKIIDIPALVEPTPPAPPTHGPRRNAPVHTRRADADEGSSWFEDRMQTAKEKMPRSTMTVRLPPKPQARPPPPPPQYYQPLPPPTQSYRPSSQSYQSSEPYRPDPQRYDDDDRDRNYRPRSRSPPRRGDYYSRDDRYDNYRPQEQQYPPPPGVSFSMRGRGGGGERYAPPPPPRGNEYRDYGGPRRDSWQPPLPPGPPPGPRRESYKPGGYSSRNAWNQYTR